MQQREEEPPWLRDRRNQGQAGATYQPDAALDAHVPGWPPPWQKPAAVSSCMPPAPGNHSYGPAPWQQSAPLAPATAPHVAPLPSLLGAPWHRRSGQQGSERSQQAPSQERYSSHSQVLEQHVQPQLATSATSTPHGPAFCEVCCLALPADLELAAAHFASESHLLRSGVSIATLQAAGHCRQVQPQQQQQLQPQGHQPHEPGMSGGHHGHCHCYVSLLGPPSIAVFGVGCMLAIFLAIAGQKMLPHQNPCLNMRKILLEMAVVV
jgi:hypothetical protein